MLIKHFLLIYSFISIFVSCDRQLETVLTIDGYTIDSNQFFSSIDRSSFKKLNSGSQRARIVKFAKEWIAANEATQLGHTLSISDTNRLLSKKNNYIFDTVFNNYLIPLVINDTNIINTISNAIKTNHDVSEIIVYHSLSKGNYVKRTPDEARKIAQIIINRIQSKNINFEEAVSIYSTIPSNKLRNGNLGLMSYGRLPKNYSDKIWNKPEGTIIGPIKTEYGYHVVKLGSSEGNNNPLDKDHIKNNIKRGKYGVLNEQMDKFSLMLRSKYNARLDTMSIIDLWRKIEVEKNYKRQPFSKLNNINFKRPIGYLNNMQLDLDWFIDNSFQHANIHASTNRLSHGLLLNFASILDRTLINLWVIDSKIISEEDLNYKINAIRQNFLMKRYLSIKKKMEPSLSEETILNQVALSHEIKINENHLNKN